MGVSNTSSGAAVRGRLIVAVDLGGTKMDIAIIDSSETIVARKRLPTVPGGGEPGGRRNLGRLCDEVREMAAGCNAVIGKDNAASSEGGAYIAALGICTPGPVDHITGTLVKAVNLQWGTLAVQEILEENLGIPVRMDHDAKTAALGELHWGRGRTLQNMVYIVVGTGVGGAIIYNREILRGEHNSSGEVGHFSINFDALAGWSSGIPGVTESYSSGPAMEHHYRELLEENGIAPESEEINGHLIGDRARAGEALALQVVERAGRCLGICIASLAQILDISHYVISSSVAKLGDLLLEPARRTVPKFCFEPVGERVVIETSTIIDTAALLGCYYIVKDI